MASPSEVPSQRSPSTPRTEPGRASLFLRGSVLAGAIGLIALFLVAFPTARTVAEPKHETQGGGGEAARMMPDVPTDDLVPRAAIALDLHLGPSDDYEVIGVVPRGALLEVVGRDESGFWLAVSVAPASKLYAWVPLSDVQAPPDMANLPLKPVVLIPTP